MSEPHASLAVWLGLIGDTVTVCGGLVLAFDAAHEAAQRKQVQRMKKVFEDLKNIRMKVKGIVVGEQDDVEYAYVRRSSYRALVGMVILFLGFGFLLASRILEVLAK